MSTIEVRLDSPLNPLIRELIHQLDLYQEALYPPESNHLDPPDVLSRDSACFVGAYEDGDVVGIGALKRSRAGHYGEIKRVYVLPERRGKGIARKIMEMLENQAREEGFSKVLLETGIQQPEAIALYAGLGYTRCGAFGDYPEDDPMSVFMEKLLS